MLTVFQPLYFLIHLWQLVLVAFCCVTAWAIVLLGLWICGIAIQAGIANVRHLYQIPCVNCQFFTGDYRLKCPVHPFSALTEEAINCSDFCSHDSDI